MGLDDKIKNAAKDLEGKAQEAFGKVTDDPSHEAAGKAKQTEADARGAVEDGKDAVKRAVD